MNKVTLAAKNLNNSLVFYRALFNRMPDELGGSAFKYRLNDLEVEISEGEKLPPQVEALSYPISDIETLTLLNVSMSRFRSLARLKNDCQLISDAFGITDPDGNNWIVGNPKTKVHFEKCYITNQLNQY